MTVPDPALVVLVGPSGSGKSAWAAARYRATEIVSSDALRAVVGSGEGDLEASADAFTLLDSIIAARVRRRLTTVVDTLGLDPGRRRNYVELGLRAGLPVVAVLLQTPAAVCRARNRTRDRPVPAPALRGQLRRMADVSDEVGGEGWDLVVEVVPDASDLAAGGRPRTVGPEVRDGTAAPEREPSKRIDDRRPHHLGFVLQISRFDWSDDPAGWLTAVASAAEDAGFEGVALMDHLLQIPQVGRPWDPIPEPWVTLGLLAAVTRDLRLGTLVSPLSVRAPGVLAKSVATLDVLTGGRTFCGVGAGWWARENAAFGLPFAAPAARLDALEAGIETMRALWAPGTKPAVGLPETTCYPRPVSRIPIIVGGSGERRTLRIAARLGDACNLPSDPDRLDHRIDVLHAHCRDVGRDPAEVAVTVLDVPVVGVDREHVATLVERLRGGTSASTFARRHHAGVVADHVRRYRSLAEHGVRTAFVALPDLAGPDDVTRMAPVIAALR